VAVIEERRCIGCALCIQACPVDAIAGAPTFMHTVIEPLCTGCELCVAPCPVDCISMQETTASWPERIQQWAGAERARGEARRAQTPHRDRLGALARRGRRPATGSAEDQGAGAAKRAAILAAVERVRARRLG